MSSGFEFGPEASGDLRKPTMENVQGMPAMIHEHSTSCHGGINTPVVSLRVACDGWLSPKCLPCTFLNLTNHSGLKELTDLLNDGRLMPIMNRVQDPFLLSRDVDQLIEVAYPTDQRFLTENVKIMIESLFDYFSMCARRGADIDKVQLFGG
jgi:hypothetical protein